MVTFLGVFTVCAVAFAAMAVGVIVSNRSLKGSCGGLSQISGLESACDICDKPCAKRRRALAEKQSY